MYRILVTGSRDWSDVEAVNEFLDKYSPDSNDIVLVHGDAPGLDTVAKRIAKERGWKVEDHPADWKRLGRGAGPTRNTKMVSLGADICLAFPLPDSVGTLDCIKKARKAGIETHVYGEAEVENEESASDPDMTLF